VLQNPAEVLTATQRSRLASARTSDATVVIRGKGEIDDPASRPRPASGMLTWRFQADSVRDFAWAAARHFIWDAVGVNKGKTLAMSLYPPSADSIWKESSQYIKFALEEYSRQWFPYPYPVAVNVNGPEGGMEYPMIVFCSERQSEFDLYYVTTHELGHEWYPMIVGSNERLYGWQDEGLNTFIDYYSVADWFRDRPQLLQTPAAAFELGAMSSWTGFVRQYTGREGPSMEPQDRNDGFISGYLAYTKPGAGLHFLRHEVVDSTAFDQAFREYTRRWAFKHPTPADFFRTMNDALGEDLSWFWRSWFYRTDHLDQAVDSVVQRDSSGTTISRIMLSNRMEMVSPVEMTVTGADGSRQIVKLPVETWMRSWTVPYFMRTSSAARPVRVEIDVRNVYPDVNRTNNVWSAPAATP
jgi:hypothetical protein